jgi:hypothetical protein
MYEGAMMDANYVENGDNEFLNRYCVDETEPETEEK